MAEKEEKTIRNGNGKTGSLLKTIPNYNKEFTSHYSNFAAVSHTPHELIVDFCLLSPPYDVDIKNNLLKPDVVSRIIMPDEVAKALVEAIEKQLDKQKKTKKEGSMAVAVNKEQ